MIVAEAPLTRRYFITNAVYTVPSFLYNSQGVDEPEKEQHVVGPNDETLPETTKTIAKTASNICTVMGEVKSPGLCVLFTFLVSLSLAPSVFALIRPSHYDVNDPWTGLDNSGRKEDWKSFIRAADIEELTKNPALGAVQQQLGRKESGRSPPHLKELIKLANATYFTPVIVFLLYAVCDFLGRMQGGKIRWPTPERSWLFKTFVALRFVLIPLTMLCNEQPRSRIPVLLTGDAWPICLVILTGFTNGYFVSLGVIHGPSRALLCCGTARRSSFRRYDISAH
ncbi:hypothetical protein ACTXT7_009626 [Hymenolepis weldensis]